MNYRNVYLIATDTRTMEIWKREFEEGKEIEEAEKYNETLIATKDKSHIALFFVDGRCHRRGIGRKLFEKALEENDKDYFTVNSSPYAKEVYEHLGFECVEDMQCVNGIRFYPMTMKVKRLTK